MQNKDKLCSLLTKKLEGQVLYPDKLRDFEKELSNRYSLPRKITFDYLTLRKEIINANDFMIYSFADVAGIPLEQFFTKVEIDYFSKMKYTERELEFPLIIPAIQVNLDQWITSISLKDLILLRDSQIINYNENAQRTMTHVLKGDIEYYKITLNKKSIRAMKELFLKGSYISNTITLNMPETTDYYYDSQKKALVINKLDYFDIIDGYHRYITLSNIINEYPEFEYNMELRITRFDNSKAQQMIWQEFQRNEMKKVELDAMNKEDVGNQIVAKLQFDTRCNIAGIISKNKGIINEGQLSKLINYFFVRKDVTKKNAAAKVIEIEKKLAKQFNDLTSEETNLLIQEWDYQFLFSVLYCFYKGRTDFKTISDVNDFLYNNNITIEVSKPITKEILRRIAAYKKELANV